MSKIFNVYEDGVDRTWYDSSNILYSECIDVPNDYKVLKIVFKNGRTYEYTEVNVNDYVMFREDISQGKAFRKYIANFPTKKLDDVNVNDIQKSLIYYQEKNQVKYPYVVMKNNTIEIYNENEEMVSYDIDKINVKELITNVLTSLKITIKNE